MHHLYATKLQGLRQQDARKLLMFPVVLISIYRKLLGQFNANNTDAISSRGDLWNDEGRKRLMQLHRFLTITMPENCDIESLLVLCRKQEFKRAAQVFERSCIWLCTCSFPISTTFNCHLNYCLDASRLADLAPP
jgi:hypothetical protein